MTWHEVLHHLDACPKALAWVAELLTHKPSTTFAEAWAACTRPHWTAWLAAKVGANVQPLKRALALHADVCEVCRDNGVAHTSTIAGLHDALTGPCLWIETYAPRSLPAVDEVERLLLRVERKTWL